MTATCPDTGKIVYKSQRAARTAVKGMRRDRKEGYGMLLAYPCGGHWHIGHSMDTHNSHQKTSRRRR